MNSWSGDLPTCYSRKCAKKQHTIGGNKYGTKFRSYEAKDGFTNG